MRTHLWQAFARLVGITALLLPLAGVAGAQDPAGSQTQNQTQAQEQQENREQQREQIRERIRALQEQVKADREAYRQAVQQYGKDSPQARAAQRKLHQDRARLERMRDRIRDRARTHRDLRPRDPSRRTETRGRPRS